MNIYHNGYTNFYRSNSAVAVREFYQRLLERWDTFLQQTHVAVRWREISEMIHTAYLWGVYHKSGEGFE